MTGRGSVSVVTTPEVMVGMASVRIVLDERRLGMMSVSRMGKMGIGTASEGRIDTRGSVGRGSGRICVGRSVGRSCVGSRVPPGAIMLREGLMGKAGTLLLMMLLMTLLMLLLLLILLFSLLLMLLFVIFCGTATALAEMMRHDADADADARNDERRMVNLCNEEGRRNGKRKGEEGG